MIDKLIERYDSAKEEYQKLIDNDFPDFSLEKYREEKVRELEELESYEENGAKLSLTDRIASTLDITDDGKLGISDLAELPKSTVKGIAKLAINVKDKASDTISSFDTGKVINDVKETAKNVKDKADSAIESFDAGKVAYSVKETAKNVKDSIDDVEAIKVAETALKIGKTAVGIQGIQNRSEAKNIMEICKEYYNTAEDITEDKRLELNFAITDFGEYRLKALHDTVGRFLKYLEALKQKNAAKEYQILIGANIDTQTLEEMDKLDMVASEALRTTAITGAFGAAAVMGTPILVTSAVGAFAAASTGTAISSLSGAAANSAILAWLGGGSIAAGGGGMAAGAATLAAVTVGATAFSAVLAAGILVSLHYGKKLTEAKEYEKEIGLAVASFEKAWIVMDGISKRTSELKDVTEELKWRTFSLLNELEKIIPEFDFNNTENVKIFNKTALMVKNMVELSQTSLLNKEGNINDESIVVTSKVREILNTEV